MPLDVSVELGGHCGRRRLAGRLDQIRSKGALGDLAGMKRAIGLCEDGPK